MQLIIVREPGESRAGDGMSLLRYALSTPPLSGVVRESLPDLRYHRPGTGLASSAGEKERGEPLWIVPRDWQAGLTLDRAQVRSHDGSRIDGMDGLEGEGAPSWIVITHGRFATFLNQRLLRQTLAAVNADVVALEVTPDLRAYREQVRVTPRNEVAGFRRLYADATARRPMPAEWPHHLLVRAEAFAAVVKPNLLADFRTLMDRCRALGVKMQGIAVAGVAYDLESPGGVLALCRAGLGPGPGRTSAVGRRRGTADGADGTNVSDRSRLIGRVLLGRQVTVEAGAVIVGPAILCDGCTVQRDAIVDSSIVGANAAIGPGQVRRDCLIGVPGLRPTQGSSGAGHDARLPVEVRLGRENAFRTWRKLSYPRCVKRVADVLAAVIVLALFAPVFPVMAVAIKLSSPGPVFFRDKRQGRHGALFACIKFRTMRQGADKIQEKLRFVCEVDGPQFKINDDPRITTVGRFLRETYLDEIPQFFNVLCGQMSVVGPRPSPEAENTLCPSWRDARLSVRPGITGLWQVCRTRAAHKDFQEWIHYDTQYVRGLSPRLDLWICWRTFRRMVENFIDQF